MGWLLAAVGRNDLGAVTGLASLLLFASAVDVPRDPRLTRLQVEDFDLQFFGSED